MLITKLILRGATRTAGVIGDIVRSYAEVFFLSKTAVGFVLVVGTLLNWRVGAAGLLAVAAAYACARLAHMDARCLQSGYYTYNPLLVGLSLGATLQWSGLTAIIIAISGAMTFLLTAGMVHALRYYLNLPTLSLPFVVASTIIHLALLKYSNLAIETHQVAPWLLDDFGLPFIITGFFKSLGAIVFIPSVLVGSIFATLLFVRSRILFSLAVAGYYLGTGLRGAMLGSAEQAFTDLYSFNFILIAMAIGGVFLVPSWHSVLLAGAATTVAMIFIDALQVFGHYFVLRAYTLPFNLVTLGVIYALAVNSYPGIARYIGATPEETLENDLVRKQRFHDMTQALYLPFKGAWNVWQGFDDEWTHKGPWRYAYDFVINDERGATHRGDGSRLSDYYCFRKPVHSPCSGRVTKVVDFLPDNALGRVDKANNWGNHIVIHDDRGFYVELSHFAQETIQVRVGERVEVGQLLGLCGNSGYSPQPHLHVHVQVAEAVGSATLPFIFARYTSDGEFHSDGLPQRGQHAEPAAVAESLNAATDFLLGDVWQLDVLRGGIKTGELTLTVQMAVDGTLYFDAPGEGKLYFGKHHGTFYFYRLDGNSELLSLIFSSLPRLPLATGDNLTWQDVVPIGVVTSAWRRALALVAAPFVPQMAWATTRHRFCSSTEIETSIWRSGDREPQRALITLSPEGHFVSFERGELCLVTQDERSEDSYSSEIDDSRRVTTTEASLATAPVLVSRSEPMRLAWGGNLG